MNDSLWDRLLRPQSWLVRGIVAWTLAVTALRGLRGLSNFAEAQWLLDYRFGFVKRAFPGTVLRAVTDALGITITPKLIEWLSILPSTIFYAVMLLLSWRIVSRAADRAGALCTTLAFVSSCFIVMNAHCLGYFDTVIYLLTIGAVALILRGHPLLSAGLQVAAILSHETFLLIGFPAVCLASHLRFRAETGSQRKWYVWGMSAILPIFVAMVLLPYFSDMEHRRQQLTDHLRNSAALHGHEEYVPMVVTTPLGQLIQSHYKLLLPRIFNPRIWLQTGPTLVLILAFCQATFLIRLGSRISCLLISICAAPLLLHLVAVDTMRLTSYSLCSAFLVLWILAETQPATGQAHWLTILAMPVICYNALMRVGLYDYYLDRFSTEVRLLLYSPAIAFVSYLLFRSYLSHHGDPGEKN